MANTLITPTMVTREIGLILENNLVAAKHVDRVYEDRFASSGGKIGATLGMRLAAMHTVNTGAALSINDYTDRQMVLTVDTQAHCDTNFTSNELTLSMEDFSDRVLRTKIAKLANYVDQTILGRYWEFGNQVGTPGTTPATAAAILAAGQVLNEESAPRDDMRAMLLGPAAEAGIVDGLKGLFHSTTEVDKQYRTGNMGTAFGFKFSMDQNIPMHTVGALGGTPLVNGAAQVTTGWAETQNLVTDGWSNSITGLLKKGDVFTIANVFAVNPMSKQTTKTLRKFSVTADVNSNGSGQATLVITPAIISSGPFQNVDAAPADNAAITVIGTAATAYPINMALHRDAICLATVDLEDVSQYGAWGGRRVYKNIAFRLARQFRIGTDDVPCRVDVLFGVKRKYNELGCRLIG